MAASDCPALAGYPSRNFLPHGVALTPGADSSGLLGHGLGSSGGISSRRRCNFHSSWISSLTFWMKWGDLPPLLSSSARAAASSFWSNSNTATRFKFWLKTPQ